MTSRRRGLCLLSDRQADEILEFLDTEFDTDDDAESEDDFDCDEDYSYDPEIEELFSSPLPPSKHRRPKEDIHEESEIEEPGMHVVEPGLFNGCADKIDPKSTVFKDITWRKVNLVTSESELLFEEPDLAQFENLDTPYKCYSYFIDGILEHITAQTNLHAK